METLMLENLVKRQKGWLRHGKVKVLPVKRSSDWLPETSDSAFMNSGAKIEYVVPRLKNSGVLVDPLADISDEYKDKLARELGFKSGDDLNIMKPEKDNFWINRAVIVDKNGKFLDLALASDYVAYKILEVNLEFIAPSWEQRYDKGTYKFALVFEDEEAKIKNTRIDVKKEAYMAFGKIDGSVKKLTDILWIYYLTSKEGKRPPNNPSLDYVKAEVGRLVDERPNDFMAIISDPKFETKALIQKAINVGLISRDGMTFKIFNEEQSKNTLDGLTEYLLDERNNNVRMSLLGKLDIATETRVIEIKPEDKENVKQENAPDVDFLKRLDKIESVTKKTVEDNNLLKEQNKVLLEENEKLRQSLIEKKDEKEQKKVQRQGKGKITKPNKTNETNFELTEDGK